MASMMMKVLALFLIAAVAVAPATEAAMSCGAVVGKLVGCMSYLRGGAGPSPACCGGVRALNGMAKSTADRQAACNCLKQASRGVNLGNAKALPGKCGVSVGYAISPSIDCSRVH